MSCRARNGATILPAPCGEVPDQVQKGKTWREPAAGRDAVGIWPGAATQNISELSRDLRYFCWQQLPSFQGLGLSCFEVF